MDGLVETSTFVDGDPLVTQTEYTYPMNTDELAIAITELISLYEPLAGEYAGS